MRPIAPPLPSPLTALARTHVPPSTAINNLSSPDAGVRQNAADNLRTDAGVPDEAIQPLIQAYQRDTDPHARAAELIALGRSGSPAAKPLIDAYVRDAKNSDEQRWGGRALKY